MLNVLVLCTGNSVRSILAEAILRQDRSGRVTAYSAGSNPTGTVNPDALRLLDRKGISVAGLRSKSWNEFLGARAPEMNLVVTVCASTASEHQPVWPGMPLSTHWGMDDPAVVPADQRDLAFVDAYNRLSTRVSALLALPFEEMNGVELKAQIDAIGAI